MIRKIRKARMATKLLLATAVALCAFGGVYGFAASLGRYLEVRRRYPSCPTAVDVGHGVFGTQGGLLFIDDEDGRAVAYAPAELHRRGSA